MGAAFGLGVAIPRRTSVGLYELERLGVDPSRLLGSTTSPAAADGPPGNEAPFAAAVGAMVAATLLPPLFGASAEGPVALAVGGGLVAWALDALAFNSAGSDALADRSVDGRRVAAHEAGHFLVAYLLGVRVERVAMTRAAAKAAGMPAVGVDVALGVRTDLWTLSAVAGAGMAGEWAGYGTAEGGRQDLVELGSRLRRAGIRGGAGGEVTGYTRWGLLQAVSLLAAQRGAFEALRTALAGGADVATCVAAVESHLDWAALEVSDVPPPVAA